MELHTIVAKLTGPIYPVGESNTDAERYENLEKYLELYSDMTTILCSIFSSLVNPLHNILNFHYV